MSGSSVRRPRVRLTINGTVVSGCRSTEVVSRNGSQAASFHVTAVYGDLTRVLGQGWIDLDVLSIGIEFGIATGDSGGNIGWVRMMAGTVDRIGLDQISGLVSLDGRDNAARLIDLPVQDAYLNTTSSEVATDLAGRCSLTADVDDTSVLVGQYYQIEHAKSALGGFSRHANAWDLLAELAELEGYELWVDEAVLHFKKTGNSGSDPFDVVYTAAQENSGSPTLTISELSMHRSAGLSGSVQVKVASWNSRQRRQVAASYPPAAITGARQFLVLKPNLLSDQADALAKTTYLQLRAHQRVLTGTMAGELALTPRSLLRLSGTGTGWDGLYTLDQIERQISLEQGFVQHITARSIPDGGGGDE